MSALAPVAHPRSDGLSHHATLRWAHAWPIAGAACLLAAVLAGLIVDSDVLLRPGWFALLIGWTIIAFAAAGLLWLRRRPASRVGLLLLLLTGLLAIAGLQGSSSSLLFSLGVLADAPAVLLVFYVLLAFPSARLNRVGLAAIAILAAAIAVGFIPWYFLSENIGGATPLARCAAGCPTNALAIVDRPDIAGHFVTAEEILRVAAALAVLGVFVGRMATVSRPRRRLLAPVYVAGAVWIVPFGLYGAMRYLVVTDEQVWDTVGWVLTAARVALPLAFVLSLLLAQLFAGASLTRMMQRLRFRPKGRELERVVQDALGDPSLELAIWQGSREEWLDSAGEETTLQDAPGRRWHVIQGEGRPLAAMRYDNALDNDPELVDAAATAVLLTLDGVRLDADLRRAVADLQDTRARLATAGDEERRKLARNLHDSAQQQLIALRIHLSLAQDRTSRHPGEAGAALEVLGHELDDALDEVRTIANDMYPPLLRDAGIGPALAQAVRKSPNARLTRVGAERYPEEIEAAVYFAALEALQNASKHSGLKSEIAVAIWEGAGEVRFEVRDDGVGFEPENVEAGSGLASMTDRIESVGGTVDIVSRPGAGATVRGRVPVGS